MRSLIFLVLISAAFILSSNIYKPFAGVPDTHLDSLSPVETKKANSEYAPAFPGQTRIQGVKTNTPYKIEKIAENIGKPWAITLYLIPDGLLRIKQAL